MPHSLFGCHTIIDTIQVGGQDIAFALRPGGDRCLLFLHGLGCSKESFDAAFSGPYFSDQFTLLAPDFIGHGHSSKTTDFSYDLEKQSELLAGLLNKLAIDRIAIVAHSMGNVPGLLLTRRDFELFGYFCLDGNLRLADCNISARVSKLSEDKFVHGLWALARRQFRCRGSLDEPEASPVAYYRSARSLCDWCASGRLLPWYKALAVENAYLYGAQSEVADLIPELDGQSVIEIPDSGHFLMNDKPELTYGEIATRLTRGEAASC